MKLHSILLACAALASTFAQPLTDKRTPTLQLDEAPQQPSFHELQYTDVESQPRRNVQAKVLVPMTAVRLLDNTPEARSAMMRQLDLFATGEAGANFSQQGEIFGIPIDFTAGGSLSGNAQGTIGREKYRPVPYYAYYGRGNADYGRGDAYYGRGDADYGRGDAYYARGDADYGRGYEPFYSPPKIYRQYY